MKLLISDFGVGMCLYDLIAQMGQSFHVAVAGIDLLVENHAIEAFFPFIQVESHFQISSGNEAELMGTALNILFGGFDTLGDFNFLLAGQQGNLPHLLEVHADGIVQNVHFGFQLFLLVLFLGIANADAIRISIYFGGINDIECHATQAFHDALVILGIDDVVGKSVIDVVESQVALLLGKFDQITDLFLNFRSIDRAVHLAAGSAGTILLEEFTDLFNAFPFFLSSSLFLGSLG